MRQRFDHVHGASLFDYLPRLCARHGFYIALRGCHRLAARHANFGGLPIDAAIKTNGAAPRCGLLVIDLRNGDIVQWFRFRGDITELFDVGIIPNARCPRGIGPFAPGLEEAMRGEDLEQ